MRMKNLLRRPPAWTQDDCYRPLHHMCSLMPNRNRNENWNKDLWDLQTPIVCMSGWMGGRHFFHHLTKSIHWTNFDSTNIECWVCLRLRAANPWQWSNANLCKRLLNSYYKYTINYREKEGGVNDLRKFRVDKISTKKSLSLQFDSAGGGQREFHWVLFSWTQRAVFNISRNTI